MINSYLPSLFGVTTGGQATGSVTEAIPNLRRARDADREAKGIERTSREPEVERALARFRTAIDGAKDVETALRDRRVQEVLLPALGLSDAIGQTGLVVRALTADPEAEDGLLSKLSDTRWRDAAKTLDLAARGLDSLRDPKIRTALEEGFTTYRWRKSQDATTPGLSDALYFEGRAATTTDVYSILGDPVLRRVVTGALGLPEELAVQGIEAQARAVRSRLPMERLSDPKEVARLAERYVLAKAQEGGSSGATAWQLSLFA